MNKRTFLTRQKRKSIVYSSVLAFLILTGLVLSGVYSGLEGDLLLNIYSASDDLRLFALIVTQLGSAWFFISLVGLMFILKWKANAAVNLLINGAIAVIANYVIKLLVSRPRPNLVLEDVLSRELFTFGSGYPSGHTALATAAALALLPFLPGKLKWIIVPWIALVGWSRVYLGVHAPFDVLGGFLLAVVVVVGLPLLPKSRISGFHDTRT